MPINMKLYSDLKGIHCGYTFQSLKKHMVLETQFLCIYIYVEVVFYI